MCVHSYFVLYIYIYIFSILSLWAKNEEKLCENIAELQIDTILILEEKMHFSQNLFAFSGGVCEYEISTIFSNQNQLSVM